MPDIGLTTLDDVLIDVRRITSATNLPLLVDADTGWDDPKQTVREMIREGAAGWEAQRTPAPSVFIGQQGLAARRARVIEPGAWEARERPAQPDQMSIGQRVFHQKFGYGRVTEVEDDKLDIAFEKAGAKRVLDRFVEKA